MSKQELIEGGKCWVDGCGGTIVLPPVENCSCFSHPPCGACVDNQLECSDCGLRESDVTE